MGERRPGHNGGGELKSGNTVNVGRKPSEVRQRLIDGIWDNLPWLLDVLAGKKVVDCQVDGTRRPTAEEKARAAKRLEGIAEPKDSDDKFAKAYLESVAAGEKIIACKVAGKRKPTSEERRWAYEQALKHGPGVKQEVTGEDGEPVSIRVVFGDDDPVAEFASGPEDRREPGEAV